MYFIIAVLILLITSIAIYQFRSTLDSKTPEPEAKPGKIETTENTGFLKEGEYPTFVTGEMEPW